MKTPINLLVRIFNDTTGEILEFKRMGASAAAIKRNIVRWAYRIEFLKKEDHYHVELFDSTSERFQEFDN